MIPSQDQLNIALLEDVIEYASLYHVSVGAKILDCAQIKDEFCSLLEERLPNSSADSKKYENLFNNRNELHENIYDVITVREHSSSRGSIDFRDFSIVAARLLKPAGTLIIEWREKDNLNLTEMKENIDELKKYFMPVLSASSAISLLEEIGVKQLRKIGKLFRQRHRLITRDSIKWIGHSNKGIIESIPLNWFGIKLNERFRVLIPGYWCIPIQKWSLIIGRSGCGKSTFLHMLARLDLGYKASVVGIPPKRWFLLRQRPELIEKVDVATNIALFASSKDDAHAIMAALGLNEEIARRYADYRLSGGERQRVALAQAIAATPELVLLDEPCASVDRIKKAQFFGYLSNLTKNKSNPDATTIVCVDHEFPDVEMLFDYVFEIINGRLVCVRHR